MLAALLEQLSRGHFILEVRHVRDLDAEIWNNNIIKGVKKIVGKRIFNLYGLCWIGGKSANQVPIKKLDLSHPGITGKLMKVSTAWSVPIAAQGNLRKTQSFYRLPLGKSRLGRDSLAHFPLLVIARRLVLKTSV